ncbi:MAG: AAA family ATPase [Candidatus Shapirobacteria bacterium]|nr:AAA family ATPase [Candidatus Shapirobacteria bacterium]
MQKPLLIVISGPSCSGKSTLAKKISDKFQLPLITKDSIKELIFDNMGWSDREWSRKVGGTSNKLLVYFLDSMLISKNPIIIESNFKSEFDTKPILEKLSKFGYFPLQIMCQCDGQVLFERFKKRSESAERHPGHNDSKNYDEFKETLLKGKLEPLEIGGEIMTFDTTDFNNIDFDKVYNKIQQLIN